MDRELVKFKKLLKQKGYFATRPRLDLFKLLQKRNAVTIEQLITLLDNQDTATIYRNINVFEKLGIINLLQLGWHSKLELSDAFQHHHHHLSCIKCDRVITLPEDKLIEKQILKLSEDKYFKPVDHQLEIRGLCSTCQNS